MLLGGAVAGYSQGQVLFSTYVIGSFTQRTFAYSVADGVYPSVTYGNYTVTEQVGSTASGVAIKEKPVGTTVYNGASLSGTGFDIEMLAAAGANQPLSALTPFASTITTFSTGSSAGMSLLAGATDPQVTAVANGPATVAIAAWNNMGGTLTTLLAAQKYVNKLIQAAKFGVFHLLTVSRRLVGPDRLPSQSRTWAEAALLT